MDSYCSLIEGISNNADFSSELIQVISVSENNIPLERSPVRFAVLLKGGSVSNAWGVVVENTGDAYIYCRDNMKGQKISLHHSGRQHIAFDKSVTRLPNFSGSRFMNQWREPEFDNQAIPTFCLLFPRWGVRLTPNQITESETIWKKNELFIIEHETEMTVVAFYIVDESREMVYRGPRSVIHLCKLPLRPGKTLHAFAERQPEGNLATLIREKAFPHIGGALGNQSLEGGSYCLAVTGERGETRYMVTFSVDYTPPC